ncbi:MAG TPA: hypothetical protein VNG04_13665 [Candidatus Acidoferrum sp.]|nr:hypothetical protein [Candidatus Acidoferrum sp.]
MNKRPGHVEVTVETGYCSFCDRVRNLRREEHHLGTLVRTVITCETCHRTLSSTMGVAAAEATPDEPVDEAAATPAAPEVTAQPKPRPAKRSAAAKAAPATSKPKATKARTTKPR